MDGAEHISIASMAPDLFCVTFSGLSKSHMIAGFRIGWMILSGNKAVAKDYIEGIKMLSNMRLCSNVPAQSIVQTALGGHQSVESYIVPGGRIYEQREFIYNALTSAQLNPEDAGQVQLGPVVHVGRIDDQPLPADGDSQSEEARQHELGQSSSIG